MSRILYWLVDAGFKKCVLRKIMFPFYFTNFASKTTIFKTKQKHVKKGLFMTCENCVDRQSSSLEMTCRTQYNVHHAALLSWKPHLPNLANWATIAKLSQGLATLQIWNQRNWKLSAKSERGSGMRWKHLWSDNYPLSVSQWQCNQSAWVTQLAYFPLNSQELWLHIHLPPIH